MSMSQMNVRIDEDLRVQGNLALQAAGYTPSQAVRKLWEFAARNRFEPEVIRGGLGRLAEAADDATADEAISFDYPLGEGWRIVNEGLRALGVSSEPGETEPSYEELRKIAYEERWSGRE